MPKNLINIGLLGLGTVGSGVVKILQRNREQIEKKIGSAFCLKKILVRDMERVRDLKFETGVITSDPKDILNDPEIDLVVEVIGGLKPASDYIKEALSRRKFVITANKDLMAQEGAALLRLAKEKERNIYYEASVGGGIPLIRPLKHSLAANRIARLIGIVNGTTNYILTKMTLEDFEFETALAEAQAKGFAEADPDSDLEGKDAAYKLAIIAGLAFNSQIAISDLQVEGIKGVTRRDILYAKELGYVIKLLAIGENVNGGLSLGVHPTLLPDTHPLAAVYYEFNAVFVEADAVGEVMFYGPGAGGLPTGSAVVADIIDAARSMNNLLENGVHEVSFEKKPVLPANRRISRFYLRLHAYDRPGVFASLATAFGSEQVSLDMIIQKRSDAGMAEIVLITHDVTEESFDNALSCIRALQSIQKVNSVFRVIER